MKIHKYYFILILLTSTFIDAGDVTGIVKDSDGNPLIGANIIISGTFLGTTSDKSGSFSIKSELNTPYSLTISYIGYKTQTLNIVNETKELSVAMELHAIGSNEVTVTARLKEEVLQDVPISVSVMDAQILRRSSDLKNIGDLSAYVPGLGGVNNGSGQGWFSIRGLGTNSNMAGNESSIGVFHDGVYFGRTNYSGAGYFDIERIEVLKGPQNTLFGRNAAAGVINVISKSPTFSRDASANIETGNEGQLKTDLAVNMPISSTLAVRLAGLMQKRDGVHTITNLENLQVGKLDNLAARISVLFRPSDKFNAVLKLSTHSYDAGGWANKSTTTDFGATAGIFDREMEQDNSFLPPADLNMATSGSFTANYVLSPNLFLNAQTIYSKVEQEFAFDGDGTPFYLANVDNPNGADYMGQEVRLNGSANKLDWMAAVSIYNENVWQDLTVNFDDATILDIFVGIDCTGLDCLENAKETSRNEGVYNTMAAYGNATYQVTDKLGVTAGLRYTIDNKDFAADMKLGNGAFHTVAEGNILGAPQTVEVSKSWSGISPRLAVSYKLSDAVNVYGSFNKGYKAGGFNNYTGITFEPETNNAMEAGVKTNIGNDKGRLNVSVYNYDYKDLQVESIINGAVEVTNAADVATKGAEVEFGYELFPGLQVIANYSLTDAEYVNYDVDDSTSFSGNIPARSPKTSYNTILQYRKPVGNIGDLFARLDYSYQSKVFHTRENDINFSDPYSLVNGSIGLDNAFGTGINVSLFGANLTDEEYVVYAEDILGVGPYYLMGFPMTVGVRLSIDGFNW